jgi:membrane protease YdiL (CAAX protease family)
MGRGLNLVRDAEGRARSGWVVLVFVVSAVLLQGGLNVVLAITGLSRFETVGSPALLFVTLSTLAGGAGATAFTWALFRVPTGLPDPRRLRQFALGLGLGALAVIAACGVPALSGASSLRWSNSPGPMLVLAGGLQLFVLAPAGFGEELLLRGLGLQALRRGLGDVGAVVLSSVAFGALHFFNPHSSWTAVLVITLVGLWFGALMVKSGSIWLPIGVHVAWNFFEGFVFGQPVSGTPQGASLLVLERVPTPGFWGGGEFGPEAAGWTAVVLSIAIGLTMRWRRRA